jgi:hypothetical protein
MSGEFWYFEGSTEVPCREIGNDILELGAHQGHLSNSGLGELGEQ